LWLLVCSGTISHHRIQRKKRTNIEEISRTEQIRKIGIERRDEDNDRYFAVAIKPEGYVIYETCLEISPRPSDTRTLHGWEDQYKALTKRILLDIVTELGTPRSGQ